MRLINRHNYEEFFLLYADNELSASDKLAVEQFVGTNPDLANELDSLLQLQLPIEEIIFATKDILHRNETTEINGNNYEAYFLLYVDNELDGITKNKVETFVLQHPSLQEAFILLKQTRLDSETILFPNKQSLYRKEEKEKPLFYLNWTRIAVAAIFFGVAIMVWKWVPDNNPANQNIALQNSTVISPLLPNKMAGRNETGIVSIRPINNNSRSIGRTTNNSNPSSYAKDGSLQKNIPLSEIDNILAMKNRQPGDLKSTPVTIERTESTIGETTNNIMVLPEGNTAFVNNVIPITVNDNEPKNTSNYIIKPVVYKELDTEDDKKSLYLGSIEINKDKLRGLFRKAGSLFRSKDKQPEDEKSEITPISNSRLLK